MNSLESRKQVFVAESELNRVRLLADTADLAAEVRMLTGRARSVGLLISSAAALIAGMAAWPRRKPEAAGKPTWPQTILKGLGLISTVWLALRPQGPRQKREAS